MAFTVGRRTLIKGTGALVLGASLPASPLLLRAAAAAEPGPEILPNPGFETLGTNGFPIGWRQLTPATTPVTSPVHSGQGAIRLADPDTTVSTGVNSYSFPVVTGEPYQASAHFLAPDSSPGIILEFLDSASKRISVAVAAAVPAPDWQLVRVREFAPANAVRGTLFVYSNSVNIGTSFADDASVRQISLQEMISVPNASFEEVSADVPSFWSNLAARSPRYVTSTAQATDGDRSALLTSTSWVESNGLRSAKILIKPGQRYRATGKVLNEQGGPFLAIEFWDTAGTRVSTSQFYVPPAAVEPHWQEAVALATAPANASFATVLLYSLTNPQRTYWDAITFDEAAEDPLKEFSLQSAAHPRYNLAAAEVPALRAAVRSDTTNPLGQSAKSLAQQVISRAEGYAAESSFTVGYYAGHTVTYAAPPPMPGPMAPPPGFSGVYPYWSGLGSAIGSRMETLAAAYTITGAESYAAKAIAYLDALSGWQQWNDPAFGSVGDQFTGYATRAFLMVYDQLHDLLTEEQRARYRNVAAAKGLDLLYADTTPMGGQIGSTAPSVVLGGLVLLGEHESALKYLSRGYEAFRAYLDEHQTSGKNEGLMYTAYTTNIMVKALDALARVTGDTALAAHPMLTDITRRWNVWSLARDAGCASYADMLAQPYLGTTLAYLNRRFDDGLAGWALKNWDHSASWPEMDQLYWFDPAAHVTEPEGTVPRSMVVDEVGQAMFRTGWERDDAVATIQAINSSFGHNNFDQNSVQLAIAGTWILRDPGYVDLGGVLVTEQRIRPTMHFSQRVGHSTWLVDGDGQDTRGTGTLTRTFTGAGFDHALGSAPGSYRAPGVTRFDRRLVRIGSRFVLLDDLAAAAGRRWTSVLFHGPLFLHAVDGVAVGANESRRGRAVYTANGNAQMWAFIGSDSTPTVTSGVFPGAEMYGHQTLAKFPGSTADVRAITLLDPVPWNPDSVLQGREIVDLDPAASGPAPTVGQNAGVTFARYSPGKVGGWVDVPMTIPTDGKYVVETIFMASGGYGKVQLAVDGANLGTVFDPAFFALVPGVTKRHGEVTMTAGTHSLRYSIVAGSTVMGIVAIRVAPVGEAPPGNGLTSRYLSSAVAQGVHTRAKRDERQELLGPDSDAGWREEWIAARTGDADSYTLGRLETDAELCVVQLSAGRDSVHRMAVLGGTRVVLDGVLLMSSAMPVDLAVDNSRNQLSTSVLASRAGSIRFAGRRPRTSGQRVAGMLVTYDAPRGLVDLSVPAGRHDANLN